MRRILLCFTVAMAIASPAKADVLGDVGQHLGQVGTTLNQVGAKVSRTLDENIGALWGFLGSSQPETGMLIPVEVTPGVRLPESVKERPTEQARVILAGLHLTYLPPARALPKPSFEKGSKFL